MELGADKDERATVVREITERYLRTTKGTPAYEIKIKLGKKRSILDQLVKDEVIYLMGDRYFPRFAALEHVDPDLRETGYKCTELVLKTFKRFYCKNGPVEFTAEQIMAEAKAIDPLVSANMIDFGILMATDFSLLRSSWTGMSDDRVQGIRITDNVLDYESLKSAWDEELKIGRQTKRAEPPLQPQKLMASDISQPTLGLLRRLLEEMPPDDLLTQFEVKKFWKDELFDFGFPSTFIDIAAGYYFRWSDIIPDLYHAKFGAKNEHFASAMPPFLCEQALRLLLAFALHHNKNTALADELRKSLQRDGFDFTAASGVDSSVPAELAQIPGKPTLIADIQQKIHANELIAIAFIDLDGFKQVNDQLGHEEGDNCLIRIAKVIGETILGKGKLYRPGGDEFVVVLPNFNRREAASTAERIRAAVDKNNPARKLKVTVSIGVIDSESTAATDPRELLAAADSAMYESKKTKNSITVK